MKKRGRINSINVLYIVILIILLAVSVFAGDLMSLQGNVDLSGSALGSGGVVVEIWDGPDVAGSNLIYNSTDNFTGSGNISSGKFDIVLGDALDKEMLNLEYGKVYYMDLYVAGNDMNFSNKERQIFMSNVGTINSSFLNTSNDYTLGSLTITNVTASNTIFNVSNGMDLIVANATGVDFDSGTLYVDEVNNRVGIGTTAPTSALHLPQENDAVTPTISFGDGDTGFYEKADDEIYYAIAGANVMRLNVADLYSPQSTGFTIKINLASSGTTPVFIPNRGDADTGIGWDHADTLSLIAGGVNVMNLNASGNVGIGTTAPTHLLSVTNTSAASNVLFNVSDGDDAIIVNATGTSFDSGTLYVDEVNNFVGIGTTAPTGGLTIGTGTNDAATSANSLYVANVLEVDGYIGMNDDIPIYFGTSLSVDSGLRWETADGNANSVHLFMSEGGSTNVPVFVMGDASIDGQDLGFFDGVTDPSIALIADEVIGGFSRMYTTNNSDASTVYWNLDVNDTVAVTADSSGNVGIGTTAPTAVLDIDSSSDLLLNVSNSTDSILYVNGTSGYVGIGTSSPPALFTIGTNTPGWVNSGYGTGKDAFISGALEVDGTVVHDGETYLRNAIWIGGSGYARFDDDRKLEFGSNGDAMIIFETAEATDATHFLADTAGKNIVIGDYAYNAQAYDHGASNDPSVFIHSATNPDQDNTRWIGLSYVGNSTGQIETGAGDLALMPAGNVGIGTTSPAYKLQVEGTTNTTDLRAEGLTHLIGNVTMDDNLTVGGNTLYVDSSSGRVGIGTTSPHRTLHLKGPDGLSGRANDNIYTTILVDNSDHAAIGITTPNDKQGQILFGDTEFDYSGSIRYDHSVNAMLFHTNGDSEKVRIDSSGNVGIGTTTPSKKLEVAGETNITGNTTIGGSLLVSNGTGTDEVFFLVDNETGRVGIGTTSPGAKLDVSGGDIHIDSAKKIYLDGGGDTYIYEAAADRIDINAGGKNAIRIIEENSGTQFYVIPNTLTADAVPLDHIITGNAALATASTNLVGGNIDIIGGGGASASAGDAHGGSVYIDGGTGYGTGSSGNVLLATIRGNVGIGTTTPGTELDVKGRGNFSEGILVGTTSDDEDGAIRLNGGSFQGYNGSEWQDLGNQSSPATPWTYSGNDIYFDDNGKVGIGPNPPTAILHVENGTAATTLLNVSDGDDAIIVNATGTSFDSGTLYVDEVNNRIGIGTTSPGATLEVYEGASAGSFQTHTDIGIQTSPGDYGMFEFLADSGSSNEQYILFSDKDAPVASIYYKHSTDKLHFTTGGWSVAETRLLIDSAGNVGIGTTSPSGKLVVAGGNVGIGTTATAPTSLLHLNVSDANVATITDMLTLEHVNASGEAADGIGSGILFRSIDDGMDVENISMIAGVMEDTSNASERGAIAFYTGYGDEDGLVTNLSSSERMRINTTGASIAGDVDMDSGTLFVDASSNEVGIGTTNPGALFDIQTSGNGYAILQSTGGEARWRILAPDGSNSYIMFDSGDEWAIGIDDSNSDAFTIAGSTDLGTDDKLTILTGGNVGIGTTSPTAKFEVYDGDANFSTSNRTGFFYQNSTQSVGIGTASPGAKLEVEVADGDNVQGLIVDMQDAANDLKAVEILTPAGYNSYGISINFDGTGVGIAIDHESTTGNEALYVTGKSVANFLQDLADGYGLLVQRNLAEAGSQPLVEFKDDNILNTQTTLKVQQDGTGDIINLFNGTREVFTVTDDGNVGIGTTSPSALLEIGNSSALNVPYFNVSDGVHDKFVINEVGNVTIGDAVGGTTDLLVYGNVIGSSAFMVLSPFVVESVDGEPIPICMKNSESNWVGCMPDADNAWVCEPNRECDKKVLRIKTTEKLSAEGASDEEIDEKVEDLKQKFKQGKSLSTIKAEIKSEVGDMDVLDELDDTQPKGKSYGAQTVSQPSTTSDVTDEINTLKSENDVLKSELCKKDSTYSWCIPAETTSQPEQPLVTEPTSTETPAETPIANNAPVIDSYAPEAGVVLQLNEAQTFSITASDLDGDELAVQWYVNSLPIVDETFDAFTFTAEDAGQFEVKVLVNDLQDYTTHTWILTVEQPAQEPVPAEQPPEEPSFGITGASIWNFFSQLF